MARESTQAPAVSALPDHDAGNGQPPQAGQSRPAGIRGPARGHRYTRQGALAALTLTAAALLIGIGAIADAPAKTNPAGPRTAAPGAGTAPPSAGAVEPPGRACDPNGIIARMPGRTGPSQGQAAQVRASFEAGFEPKRDGWSAWWGKKHVIEDLTTSEASDGRQSLRGRVTSGEAAIGTIHLAGLAPGSTVTTRIWYGGQGEGYICPFVQTRTYTIEWIPQPDLQLSPSDWPGWRTYTWAVPGFPLTGTGIELNNIGASDFVILLDAVSW